jgi:hypothetical protein
MVVPLFLKPENHHFSISLAFQKVLDHQNRSSELRVMPKIRKGDAVFGHVAGGGGATTLGHPGHTKKGGVTPRLGCVLATSSVAFFDPQTTQLALFFSFSSPLHQVDPNKPNNFPFAKVLAPPSVQHHVQVC